MAQRGDNRKGKTDAQLKKMEMEIDVDMETVEMEMDEFIVDMEINISS